MDDRIWAKDYNYTDEQGDKQAGDTEYIRADIYERLRAAIAQMSADLKLAQTHITNATDEARRALTKEGEK